MPMVISLVVVLVAIVTGCGRTPRYDGRLTAADSLMRSNPDSALAIVEAVVPDSLASEGDRAYHDLLLTQARYRCYITATTDSDINRALAYYQRHSGEREKLTRAYIYKGAVMEELGHPDSAMLYYKQAEAVATPDDYFNLGYTNLRIAQLYQSFYVNDSAVVHRMKQAAGLLTKAADTAYLITALGTQGAFPEIIGQDSARFYLRTAIELGKKVNSPKRFQYQSKLAGLHFYDGDYSRAKDLAMEVFREGRESCNEQQFYYYAARSYIHLGQLDSARWLMASIPKPISAVDSMNHYLTLADFSRAEHQYEASSQYDAKAKKINLRFYAEANNSKLTQTELAWDASSREKLLKEEYHSGVAKVIVIGIAFIAALICAFWLLMRWKSYRYQREIDDSRLELQRMIAGTDELEAKLIAHENTLAQKDRQLREVINRNRQLETRHSEVGKRVSEVVRYRHEAFRELYADLRVKPDADKGKGHSVPLYSLIKELTEKKRILRTPPKFTFWNNLKQSVDGEFNGIASYVQDKYPQLTIKDHHLFWLLCAGAPNPIIRLCMNYANDRTVSNNKKRLLNEKMGLEVKLDEFINAYLQQK